jgi:3-deoxy-D-manno-octulosonic-acid transferase
MTLREEFADLRLIVVPRHPERFDGAARDVEAKGWPVWRLSTSDQAPDAVAPAGAAILVDRMGVLLSAWRLATVAFVGGSLIPHGGQNPLEPAGLGVATVFGPHMFNFREVVKSLLDRDACTQIQEALQLPSALRDLLADPDLRRVRGERAREAVAAMRGAGARTAELLAPMLRRGDEESEDRSRE